MGTRPCEVKWNTKCVASTSTCGNPNSSTTTSCVKTSSTSPDQPPFLHAPSGHQTAQDQPPHQAIRTGVRQTRGRPTILSVISLQLRNRFGPRGGHVHCRHALDYLKGSRSPMFTLTKKEGTGASPGPPHVPACKH